MAGKDQNQLILSKMAEFMEESNKMTKRATELAKKLLEDNEHLAGELEAIKADRKVEERKKKIDKIISLLTERKLLNKADTNKKIAQLEESSDEFLDDFLGTLTGLKGDKMPKEAAENTFDTFEFMHPSINSEASDEKARPAFADAFK